MDWITIKLMQYQLKKAKNQSKKQKYSFVKRAFDEMAKSYENTIWFLKADKNNFIVYNEIVKFRFNEF